MYDDDGGCILGCFWLAFVGMVLAVQTWAFDYSLQMLFGKDVNVIVDFIGGLFTSGFILVLAVVLWILQIAGAVQFPVF